VLFNLKARSFSPQKSSESVVSVREAESVSLNVYYTLLLTLKPAKVIKFSIESGTMAICVSKHELTIVN